MNFRQELPVVEGILVIDGDSFLSFLLRFVEKNGFFALKGV